MKVLVLENSRLFQKILREILEELSCDVDIARTGEDGLGFLQKESYQLIIASQHIFDSTGHEFADYCRTREHTCPIMLLSSDPNETLLKNARKAGITDVYPKSNLSYLRESIKYYVEGDDSIDIQGGRVMYVEDSKSIAHVMIKQLKKLNLEITHFKNAEDALNDINKNEYDLVITDIVLDGAIDGLTFARMIRSQKTRAASIPILALTGQDDPNLRVELLRAGTNDYVTKPPIEEELSARVNNLITNKRLLDQVQDQKRTLHEIAMKDQLTGCHNRHCLVEYAPKFISDCARYNYPLSILVLDLDHFKGINDKYGHQVGDVVLSCIGDLLMDSVREGDFVARIGGEEFLIVLPHCALRDASMKAEQFRKCVQKCKPAGLVVTASIGVASLSEEHDANFDKLFKSADTAVYESKENGRNRVTIG